MQTFKHNLKEQARDILWKTYGVEPGKNPVTHLMIMALVDENGMWNTPMNVKVTTAEKNKINVLMFHAEKVLENAILEVMEREGDKEFRKDEQELKEQMACIVTLAIDLL